MAAAADEPVTLGPGVVVFDEHGRAESISPAAEHWIKEAGEQELRAGRTVDVALTNSPGGDAHRQSGDLHRRRQLQGHDRLDPIAFGSTTLNLVTPSGFSVPSNRAQAIITTVT